MKGIRSLVPSAVDAPARAVYDQLAQATRGARALPDFVVLGGQRCGTTSLFKDLAAHPQVLRPGTVKGTDYYTLHSYRGLDWYRGHFPVRALARLRTRRTGAPQVFEACTYYLFHPQAVGRMVADMPDIKLVVMLRDPVERAFSHFKHEVARGFETVTDFEQALDLEPSRLEGEVERMAADPRYESIHHRHHAYATRGQYAEQLERVFEHYPREQVHICQSESFFAEPDKEFARLTDFLGLERWQPASFDQFNARPSKGMSPRVRARLVEHFTPHDARLAELLGEVPAWVAARD